MSQCPIINVTALATLDLGAKRASFRQTKCVAGGVPARCICTCKPAGHGRLLERRAWTEDPNQPFSPLQPSDARCGAAPFFVGPVCIPRGGGPSGRGAKKEDGSASETTRCTATHVGLCGCTIGWAGFVGGAGEQLIVVTWAGGHRGGTGPPASRTLSAHCGAKVDTPPPTHPLPSLRRPDVPTARATPTHHAPALSGGVFSGPRPNLL